MVWPGLAVLLTTLAFNLLGDGLRDAFDPRAVASSARVPVAPHTRSPARPRASRFGRRASSRARCRQSAVR